MSKYKMNMVSALVGLVVAGQMAIAAPAVVPAPALGAPAITPAPAVGAPAIKPAPAVVPAPA